MNAAMIYRGWYISSPVLFCIDIISMYFTFGGLYMNAVMIYRGWYVLSPVFALS